MCIVSTVSSLRVVVNKVDLSKKKKKKKKKKKNAIGPTKLLQSIWLDNSNPWSDVISFHSVKWYDITSRVVGSKKRSTTRQ